MCGRNSTFRWKRATPFRRSTSSRKKQLGVRHRKNSTSRRSCSRRLRTTSEREIDAGRWSKEVVCFGKTKKTGFSIPNLLDPPDRQEWIRRGMMPERRGNERHFKMVQEFIQQHGERDEPR